MTKTAKMMPLSQDIPLEEAEEIRKTDDPRDYGRAVISDEELMGMKIPERKFILNGLIAEKTITIVNGFRGSGKSWMAMGIVNEVAWGGRIGPWDAPEARNVMLVDGEMPLSLLQERFKMLNRGRDIKNREGEVWIYAEAYAYRIGLKRASILDPAWREYLLEETERRGIELLVLDNLSSLAPGIDENDKMAFDPVNRWLLELRFQGVSVVMTHHTGKSGQQRGTTAHEDHVDLAIDLTRPPDHRPHLCHFVCTTTKDRACATEGRIVTLELVEGEDGRMEFAWTERGKEGGRFIQKYEVDKKDLDGIGWKEAKDKWGMSKKTYYRIKSGR